MTRILTGTREYSTAFKLKVIEKVESGMRIRGARRRYKIFTILREHGHLIIKKRSFIKTTYSRHNFKNPPKPG